MHVLDNARPSLGLDGIMETNFSSMDLQAPIVNLVVIDPYNLVLPAMPTKRA